MRILLRHTHVVLEYLWRNFILKVFELHTRNAFEMKFSDDGEKKLRFFSIPDSFDIKSMR